MTLKFLARPSSIRLCGRSLCERSEILHVEDRSKVDQTPSELHFRHRRQGRELFRNLALLGLNSLIISCAKLCMKANQLDLRAAFFMFFTSDAKSNRKYLLILLFSGLDGRETLFIALLAWCRLFPDAFRTAGVQCIDPRGGSLKMNSTPIATMPIAVPTMPRKPRRWSIWLGVISGLQRSL